MTGTGAYADSDTHTSASAPGCSSDMRIISRAEVTKHKTLETGIWTTFKDGVYDITDFVANHPGGSEKVQLAAGGRLEPYWNLYRQHYNSPVPQQLLSEMCIGRLDPNDVKEDMKTIDSSDPYSTDPDISPVLQSLQRRPINAEPPGPLLTHSWLTPNSIWFVRNHHPVPQVDEKDYKMEVVIPGLGTRIFSLEDLKTKFRKTEVVATLQCGGNRRGEMSALESTAGTPWATGAMGNARWEGVLLSDLLRYCGLRNERVRNRETLFDDLECSQTDYDKAGFGHVQFTGLDDMNASIPTSKALSRAGDVLLAYRMNGDPIPPEHGYPVRVVVPGHVGVRSVKHVKHIEVRDSEAEGTWQRGMAYKGFGPSKKSTSGIEVSKIPSLQEQPVQSTVTVPPALTAVHAGDVVTAMGYAYSGGGRGIVRVDVSIDGGKTWTDATLTEGSEQPKDRAWAWTFWECDIEIPKDASTDTISIISKATDVSYNVQPDTVEGIWNLRGINNNAWHRVPLKVLKEDDV
eukprot:CAMPEP_0185026066 /NCGR_PEP_ID=MMETSP1103-20130426/9776_1 /TAXON_ID=36769 /ORGANISM="Paraphysomonas bandaiensis, Strain Caron Lab Isolate" /LENGTH=516 /DNA_ID=CAMNT_0027559511 /DNA_START=230 /DNA_END=1780 /DNA_ORIENTATION=-